MFVDYCAHHLCAGLRFSKACPENLRVCVTANFFQISKKAYEISHLLEGMLE